MADPILDSFDAPSFSIDGETYVLRGTTDPSTGAGFAAPISSLFLRKPAVGIGQLFLKTGAADTAWVDISSSSGGTVTSVGAIQPSEGLTISGGPITTTGSFTFALANDLAALEGLTGTGIAVRINTDTWVQRQLTSSSGSVSITNPAGVAGNPSIDLPAVGTAVTDQLRKISTDAFGRVSATSAVTSKFIVQGTADAGLIGAQFLGALGTGLVKNTTTTGVLSIASAGTDYIASGLYTAQTGLTLNTARLLGRTTAGTGAAEEITVGSGLTLAGGVLSNIGASVVKRIWHGSVASKTGNTVITPGTTPPLITAGTQIWSQVVTPNTVNDEYTINAAFSVSSGTANATVTIALFRDNTYIGGAIELDAGSLRTHQIAFIIADQPATTTTFTYSMRIGTTSGSWWVNRRAAENTYGGARSGWSILEH